MSYKTSNTHIGISKSQKYRDEIKQSSIENIQQEEREEIGEKEKNNIFNEKGEER